MSQRDSIPGISICVSIIIPLLISPSAAALPTQATHSALIKGRIERVEMPPWLPRFHVGDKYDDRLVPTEQYGYWWKVPDWLVGTWHSTGRMEVSSVRDLVSDKSLSFPTHRYVRYRESEHIGFQLDSQGSVWTCVPVPYRSIDEEGSYLNVNIITSAEATDVSANSATLLIGATTIKIDPATNAIVAVLYRQSMQTYTPLTPSLVQVRAAEQFFDEEGSPTYFEQVSGKKRLAANFGAVDFFPLHAHWQSYDPNGSSRSLTDREAPEEFLDLRASFAHFLVEHGLKSLVPPGAKFALDIP